MPSSATTPTTQPTDRGLGFDLGWRFDASDSTPAAIYKSLVATRPYPDLRGETVAVGGGTPPEIPDQIGAPVIIQRSDDSVEAVFDFADSIASLAIRRGTAGIRVASTDRVTTDAIFETIAAALPAPPERERDTPVTYWSANTNGGQLLHRRIVAREWTEIATGYGAHARARLDELLAASPTEASPRLILWHGPPGTGKTNALRALAHGWQGWCATHLVIDPETLLNSTNGYLMDVLGAGDLEATSRPWKMLVLEDAGGLLAHDARQQAGQALSRMLNITDGLLGQEMKVLVLVTTNEPLGRLHPAV